MSTTAEALLAPLLALPEQERLMIADRLHESLHEPSHGDDLSEEMKATLDRRWEEIESGEVECIPHGVVMEKLRARYAV